MRDSNVANAAKESTQRKFSHGLAGLRSIRHAPIFLALGRRPADGQPHARLQPRTITKGVVEDSAPVADIGRPIAALALPAERALRDPAGLSHRCFRNETVQKPGRGRLRFGVHLPSLARLRPTIGRLRQQMTLM